MSHTPEPWYVLQFDGSLDLMVYGPTTLHRPICKVFDWIDYREEKGWSAKETANLIAAAPDLLAALIDLRDALIYTASEETNITRIERASLVIAKATGSEAVHGS